MKILLYNPDNGVTRNFMPHLWMFLLKALTPPEHEVLLIDGNAQPMTDAELVRFVLEESIALVGISAMTRMIAKAYRVADAVRAAGVTVAAMNKNFNKPCEYAAVLQRLARRNVYAITSFIFGLDNDKPGVAERTLRQMQEWPPGLPVFGQIKPFPATPLYERLEREGRLTRPKHWLDFAPFQMAHTHLKMTREEADAEVEYAWTNAYSPSATRRAVASMEDEPAPYKISHLIARLFFRGIYFPPRNAWGWLMLLVQNRGAICQVIRESFTNWAGRASARNELKFEGGLTGRKQDAI